MSEPAAPERTVEASGGAGSRPTGASIRRWVELVLLVAMVAFPLLSSDVFLIDRFGRYFLFAIFAMSVDLIWGYGGMFTFGHAVFFGGAAYVVGILTTREWWLLPLPLWAALIGALVFCVLLALAMSAFTFSGRGALRGVEFAVVTLAVAVIAERVANAGGRLTGGQNGILIDARLDLFGLISLHRGYGFYALTAVLLVVTYLALRRFLRSQPGLLIRGVRENEERVGFLGYAVPRVKRRTFVLSAVVAGMAGAVFYVHEGIVSPGAVGVGASTLVLLWVVLGGRGTLIGPVVGAIVLSYLTATLSGRWLGSWLVVVGVILVLVIVFLPSGIFGILRRSER